MCTLAIMIRRSATMATPNFKSQIQLWSNHQMLIIIRGRPGYFYWESVLFPTTSMKWDNFSRFSDQYFLLQNHMTSRLYIWYIFIYVCMFYIVSFQTLQFHTKRIWENKTCFHYLSVRLQLLHSCEHPSLQWVGIFYMLLPSRTCLVLSKKFHLWVLSIH